LGWLSIWRDVSEMCELTRRMTRTKRNTEVRLLKIFVILVGLAIRSVMMLFAAYFGYLFTAAILTVCAPTSSPNHFIQVDPDTAADAFWASWWPRPLMYLVSLACAALAFCLGGSLYTEEP